MLKMSETGYLNVAEIFGENVFNDAVMQALNVLDVP